MDEMLRAAIELRDEALMCKMLQCGADATSYETSWLHPARRREQDVFFTQTYFANPSALMMAVRTGGRIANLMLDYLLLKGQLAPSIVADAYIAAAYGGHYTIMLRLDTMHTSEMVCNTEGITPLQAAVVGGNSTVRKHLLERYGGASSLLVFVAAFLANTNVLQLLIDYGGNPNNQIVTHDIKLYDYLNIPGCRYGYPIAILTALIPSITRYNCKEQSVLKLIDNGATLSPGDVAALSRLCLHRCLKVALTAGGNPEDEDGIKRTALQCALDGSVSIDEGDLNSNLLFTVGLLIQAGAKLTGGEVVKAIRLREKDAVLLLLRHGGTLTDVDETGRGCLEAEINARNDRSLQEALEMQEFPIDAGPLCAAIHEQDWALVGRLFERVHNPLNCHLLEGTAVGLAAEAGQLDILDRLLVRFTDALVLNSAILPFVFEEGALMPSRGFTIERCRDRSGYWRAPPDEEGEPLHTEGSPLALAALGKYTSGFRELLRCGCSMDRIAWNIIAESERSSDYLQLLKAFGCGLGTSTKHDRELKTALCEAITVRKHDMARYLVEVGSNVNEYDISIEGSVSPLQCAMKEGDIDMAVYLLEQGANVNDPPAFEKGATALQFAAIGGHIGFSGRLLQLGAKVNARGSSRFGRSALEGAAEHGRLDMLALLVHYGAVTTGQGRQQLVTAVAYAQGRAHYTAAEWLKENCGWTDADQTLLERIDADDEEDQEECLMLYCCGEYHVSEGQCVYHYTEEQRNNHYNDCVFCKELRDGRDDGSESNFLSEDKDTDSVGDED
ncbi:hypothetical protein FNYG_15916 [Fusarium nygamai]|uniref:Uncharacterized protein n=1 Tax=Gibberella nygamai TaxID=42673 RepID=A0A2K0U063_GIBNY|nr:hypothetical protein FNYG_15916 [Fusarium nygamai]